MQNKVDVTFTIEELVALISYLKSFSNHLEPVSHLVEVQSVRNNVMFLSERLEGALKKDATFNPGHRQTSWSYGELKVWCLGVNSAFEQLKDAGFIGSKESHVHEAQAMITRIMSDALR